MTAAEHMVRVLPDGVQPTADGSCSVSGPTLAWVGALDRAIVTAARTRGAAEHMFPPMIAAADLKRIDYFRSFPHLLTMPVALPDNDSARERFAAGSGPEVDGSLPLIEHAPVDHALTPAACYPIYPMLSATTVPAARLLTVRSTCFRREAAFVPLRRQWAFTMREIVCIGSAAETAEFLGWARSITNSLAERLGLRITWCAATDPFFKPNRSGRALLQRLAPVKNEAMIDGLAIGSTNLHHEHFGEAFDIRRCDGSPAHSSCLAFGLDRWLGVMAGRWGPNPSGWPDPRGSGDANV